MTRIKKVLAATSVAALAVFSFLGSPEPASGIGDERPNFVLVILDDASIGQLQKYLPLTNRRFKDFGVKLLNVRNAYTTTPLCAPSRASLLTGEYAHTTGVHFNDGVQGGAPGFAASGADQDTIGTRLQSVGYQTAIVGKYMNAYESLPGPYLPPGWDYWRVIRDFGTGGFFEYSLATEMGTELEFGDRDRDYSTDVFTRQARRFLGAMGPDPFLLCICPTAPHEPAIPASRHSALHPTLLGAPRPPNYANPVDKIGKPDWVQGLTWTTQKAAEDDAFYIEQARTIAAVDEMLVKVINGLDALGRLSNTIFFFATDNGYAHGEHYWKGKGHPYEPVVKTSLVIGSSQFAASGERLQLAGLIDVAATMEDLAGYVPVDPAAGVSLVPIFDSTVIWPREDILLERRSRNPSGAGTPANPIPTWNGIVARRQGVMWKYVEIPVGVVNRELYDLTNDPYELENIAEDPTHAALVSELSLRIADLLDE